MQEHCTTKSCRGCKQILPLEHFSTYDNGRGPRRRGKCRGCRNEYQQAIRKNDNQAPEKPPVTEKSCCDCKTVKPIEDYARQKTSCGNWTRGSICKPCRATRCRDWNKKHSKTKLLNGNLLRSFGITLEDFKAMEESQNALCAICGSPAENTNYRNWRLHVDHCHSCGEVRMLLCPTCNNGLGCFKDDLKLLEKAIEYLKLHSCKS